MYPEPRQERFGCWVAMSLAHKLNGAHRYNPEMWTCPPWWSEASTYGGSTVTRLWWRVPMPLSGEAGRNGRRFLAVSGWHHNFASFRSPAIPFTLLIWFISPRRRLLSLLIDKLTCICHFCWILPKVSLSMSSSSPLVNRGRVRLCWVRCKWVQFHSDWAYV